MIPSISVHLGPSVFCARMFSYHELLAYCGEKMLLFVLPCAPPISFSTACCRGVGPITVQP